MSESERDPRLVDVSSISDTDSLFSEDDYNGYLALEREIALTSPRKSISSMNSEELFQFFVNDADSSYKTMMRCMAMFVDTKTFFEAIKKYCARLKEATKSIKNKAFDIIYWWILNTPKSELSVDMRTRILGFIECNFSKRKENKVKLLLIKKILPSKFVKPIFKAKPRHPLRFLDYSPILLAEQLTIVDAQLFGQIQNHEFFNGNWMRPNKNKLSPNIVKMTAHFNKLTSWVATQILNSQDSEVIILIIKRILKTIQCLIKIGNLNCALSLYSGLTMHPIIRLKKIWAALPLRYREFTDAFDDLGSVTQNYQQYRSRLAKIRQEKGTYIPFLVFHLRDAFGASDAGENFLDAEKKKINCEKMATLGTIIDGILCSNIRYNFAIDPLFQAELRIINPLKEEELDQLSFQIQPVANHFIDSGSDVDNFNHYSNWRPEQVSNWVEKLGDEFRTYAPAFLSAGVDGQTLQGITSAYLLRTLNIEIVGHRKKLLHFIRDLEIESAQNSSGSSNSVSENNASSSSSLIPDSNYLFLSDSYMTWGAISVKQWLKLNQIESEEIEKLTGVTGEQLVSYTTQSLVGLGLKLGTAKKILKQRNNLTGGTLAGLPIANKSVSEWSTEEVAIWLSLKKEFALYADVFRRENISGQVLSTLQKNDLVNLGVSHVGTRIAMVRAIREAINAKTPTITTQSSQSLPHALPTTQSPAGGSRRGSSISTNAAPGATGSPLTGTLSSSSSSSSLDLQIEWTFKTKDETKVVKMSKNTNLFELRRRLKKLFSCTSMVIACGDVTVRTEDDLQNVLRKVQNTVEFTIMSQGDPAKIKRRSSYSTNSIN
eukprot:TRINITY_DN2146_c1_g2_i1.p1 TRINITY_DN2146_c1_g2~~TRINITY_DN2146_c1_g2_i1.p1  ORF type:complete len:829 (-),score=369.26 TRINITY_DN2146_c1_g2_i1:78-2564(-)